MAEETAAKGINARTILNAISITGLALTVVLCVYAWHQGFFTSQDVMESFVKQAGFWGPVVFILIQIVQVVIPVIPGGITLLVGVVVFGPVFGFIYNYIGIAAGSVIAFFMARSMGKPFLQKISSAKTYDKYIGWLDKGKRFDTMFAIAIVMPVAPDDFLCMLAGITKMKFEKFVAIILLGKPWTILAYSFFLSTLADWILKFL
jgi:uncharacterized membrane protein YdjX (TVP38/TMEM64 family)